MMSYIFVQWYLCDVFLGFFIHIVLVVQMVY